VNQGVGLSLASARAGKEEEWGKGMNGEKKEGEENLGWTSTFRASCQVDDRRGGQGVKGSAL